ncbi:MAG: hypothetical protein IPO92_08860 [Saprospiraceae bacterium]|nr:hypothetical protein [Saprospiraceae bacterium]
MYKDTVLKINKQIYKILFFKDVPLFITMTDILHIKKGQPESIFTAKEGRVFDVDTFDDRLFISVKKEIPGAFIFNSFSTENVTDFRPEEEVHFPLSSHLNKRMEKHIQKKNRYYYIFVHQSQLLTRYIFIAIHYISRLATVIVRFRSIRLVPCIHIRALIYWTLLCRMFIPLKMDL